MARAHENALLACGLPVFFPLGAPVHGAMSRPRNPHGQSVRVWARSLSVMQKEAVAYNTATGAAWRLASDEGPYLDGFDTAPCPLSFLSTGMVSSFFSELLALADRREIVVRDLELVQHNYYTMQGSALRGTMTGGALPVDLDVHVASGADDAAVGSLVNDAIDAAPVSCLLHGQHPSLFSLRCNGDPVDLESVRALAPLEAPDPALVLDSEAILSDGVAYQASSRSAVIERISAADTIEGVAGGAHTSLAETQQRKLHLQVTCRRRRSGVLEIEQRLHSPIGSTFRFLCDPGGAKAPDPASYIAAGIAFCFMTQLGRYAKIARKTLDGYNVIQDAHLPLAGGNAVDPIETHVYLTTTEDADFARKCVQMGEQTCFLHALCRTDLLVDARITRN